MNRFYKYIGLAIILFSFLFTSAVIPVQAAEPAKPLRVVMDDNYPPFAFRDSNGQLCGILIDLWQLWEQKTGVPVKITGTSWSNAYSAMLAGEYDVLDTITYTPERTAVLSFTPIYTSHDMVAVFHRSISGITDLKSLRGFTIGVKKADSTIKFLQENGIDAFAEYPNYQDMVEAAKIGEIKIFVMSRQSATYLLNKAGIIDEFQFSPTVRQSNFSRAVKLGNKETLDMVEQGFSTISVAESGAIERRWVGNTLAYEHRIKQIIIVLVSTVLVILILSIWVYSLRRVMQRKASMLSAVLHTIPDQIFTIKRNGILIDYKPGKDEPLAPPEVFLNKNLTTILPPEISQKITDAIERVLSTNTIETIEYQLPINGLSEHYEMRIVTSGFNEVIGIVRNITARKEMEQRLETLSNHDALSGLYNRGYFERELQRLESKNITDVGIIVFDVDGLKIFNDSLGHSKGDELLVAATNILKSSFNDDAVLCRIGGDEFAVIIHSNSTDTFNDVIRMIDNKIVQYNSNNPIMPLSLSSGYAINRKETLDMEDLFKLADDRMYRQKMHSRSSTRSAIVQALIKALEARDFQTEGHCNRVEELLVRFAKVLNLPVHSIANLRLFANFHDIGKVGIPDQILFKPGALTNEEFTVMKQHSEIGYRIAITTSDLKPIADWILKHHEWWNGRGYPLNLREE